MPGIAKMDFPNAVPRAEVQSRIESQPVGQHGPGHRCKQRGQGWRSVEYPEQPKGGWEGVLLHGQMQCQLVRKTNFQPLLPLEQTIVAGMQEGLQFSSPTTEQLFFRDSAPGFDEAGQGAAKC